MQWIFFVNKTCVFSSTGTSLSQPQQPDNPAWRALQPTQPTGTDTQYNNNNNMLSDGLVSVFHSVSLCVQAVVARANSLKNSGVPDDIFQLDDLSVLVQTNLLSLSLVFGSPKTACTHSLLLPPGPELQPADGDPPGPGEQPQHAGAEPEPQRHRRHPQPAVHQPDGPALPGPERQQAGQPAAADETPGAPADAGAQQQPADARPAAVRSLQTILGLVGGFQLNAVCFQLFICVCV